MTIPACSDLSHEPLPGTAKTGKLFIALEHPYGWSRDILDGGVFGDELTARIKGWLAERGGALQLVRKPGRLGQAPCDGLTVFVAHCPPDVDFGDGRPGPRLERLKVADAEALLDLDIRLGRPTAGAETVDHPLLLVCTHGKRDVCCALKGRPVALRLANVHPEVVWETSHSKGHRFAPALVLLPWNYSYGRLSVAATDRVIRDAAEGVLHEEGCRGRGVWGAAGQAAELAARAAAGQWGLGAVESVTVADTVADLVGEAVAGAAGGAAEGSLADGDATRGIGDTAEAVALVEFADGRRHLVGVEPIVTDGVISSCGDDPGPKKGWRALEPVEIAGA